MSSGIKAFYHLTIIYKAKLCRIFLMLQKWKHINIKRNHFNEDKPRLQQCLSLNTEGYFSLTAWLMQRSLEDQSASLDWRIRATQLTTSDCAKSYIWTVKRLLKASQISPPFRTYLGIFFTEEWTPRGGHIFYSQLIWAGEKSHLNKICNKSTKQAKDKPLLHKQQLSLNFL